MTDPAVLVEELHLHVKDIHYIILISKMVQIGRPVFEIILWIQNSDLESSKIEPKIEIQIILEHGITYN